LVNIPIPKPNAGEKQSSYINRCVSFIFSEGTLNGKKISRDNPGDRKQAVAICYSTWRSSKKSEDDEVCINCGLKDNKGYFCRIGDNGTRYYYDSTNLETKELAKIDIINDWIATKQEEPVDGNIDTAVPQDGDKRDEFIKECIAKKVGQGESESTAREQCIQEWDSKNKSIDYSVPKSKDEIKPGTVISYKGKIGKVVKVINT
jgi:hypothetical protein